MRSIDMNTERPQIQLEDNSEQRTPCVVVVDGSASMDGERIDALNDGLKVLESALKADAATSMRVRVCLIRFGDDNAVDVLQDFTDASEFSAPIIRANGRTPLGTAMALALDKIEEEKQHYRDNAISYTRPWIFLISDGLPTDPGVWETTADRCQAACQDNKVAIFPLAVQDDVDMDVLDRFSDKGAMKLTGLQFKECFLWLSTSLQTASTDQTGEETQIEAPEGWCHV